MIKITIPFSGFYNSWHDDSLEQALSDMFQDDSGDFDESRESEYEKFSNKVQWRKAYNSYAAAYSEVLRDECKLPGLQFVELWSPRFYNYETDSIYCNLPAATLQQIWADCDKQALQTLATERLTARDGFSPFYSADVADWGDNPLEWESPLQSLLIESWCNEWEDSEWRDSPWGAMESYECNGWFETWIEESTK